MSQEKYILIYTTPYGVVFLQHGLLDSAHTWINNLNNESLAFILAEQGYDVWLGNSRGSTYSRSHKELNPNDRIFWDFSWDEMVQYDLNASIYAVLNISGVDKLFLVGHSQGAQISLARLCQDQGLASKIHTLFLLAPVAYLIDIKSPIRYIAPYVDYFEKVLEWFGSGQFLPTNKLIDFLGSWVCPNKIVVPFCENIIFLLTGYDGKNLNKSRIPVYLAHTPAGTSVKNMIHYCQAIVSEKFRKFDYGIAGNLLRYGHLQPPNYPLDKLNVPTVVFYGGSDWLSGVQDVAFILSHISPSVLRQFFLPNYNHLDFVWGLDAAKLVYQPMLDLMHKWDKNE